MQVILADSARESVEETVLGPIQGVAILVWSVNIQNVSLTIVILGGSSFGDLDLIIQE